MTHSVDKLNLSISLIHTVVRRRQHQMKEKEEEMEQK